MSQEPTFVAGRRHRKWMQALLGGGEAWLLLSTIFMPPWCRPLSRVSTIPAISSKLCKGWAPDIEPGLGWPADGLDSRPWLAGLARSPAHAVMQSCTGCCCWWSHECEAGAGVWWRLSSVLCTHRPPLSSGHDPAAAARPALTM